jgi:uncharacterized protein YlxW (UPF0749 family)
MTTPVTNEPDASLSLLERLVDDALDPGYKESADRGETRSGDWRHSVAFALAIGVTAALAAAAVLQVQSGAPSAGQTRADLVDRVVRADSEVEALDARQAELAKRAERLRTLALNGTSSDRALAEEVAALDATVGVAPMSGPGVDVTLSDGPPAPAGTDGPDLARVLDTDVQLVVNGLFASGAEAVAVNGQRITALSPIRSAGEAVLVGFRPLTPPYVVSAVGPDDLAEVFESSPTRTALGQLEAAFGMGVDVVAQDEVTVPGRGDLQLRYVTKEKKS